ncbi:MAG TPA: 50S ribosomal protein L3 [Candidatus Saccharimonadales bacterium]|nr:50S ribosomal protein L3 [Candidatus Saccharimonadales bacterium]
MMNTLIGQKVSQAQSFLENGTRIPVTEISVGENVVLQVKTVETDKYSAVQLGSGSKKKPIRAVLGHAKKAGLKNASLKIKEVRDVSEADLPKTGEVIKVDGVFKPGDIVEVTGTSKGKGFAGVVKRYNFRGGPKTHGQSDRHRAPGSIGQSTTPGRVYRGKRMAGRMGQDTVTIKNLTVVDVDSENNKLYVSGLIPGNRNSFVYITKIGENKKFVPLLSDKEAASNAVEAEVLDTATSDVTTTGVIEDVSAEQAEDKVADAATDKEEVRVEEQVEVKTAAETVETAEETVKTAAETVVTAEETIAAPAEDSAKQNSEEIKVDDSKKAAVAESSGEPKEENA